MSAGVNFSATQRFTIHKADESHCHAIAEMAQALLLETEERSTVYETVFQAVLRIIQSDSYYKFVAVTQGHCVGQLLAAGHEFSDSENRGWLFITSLYVCQEYRGFGIGRRLFDTALRTAADAGFVGVRLFCHLDNYETRAWYAKRGLSEPPYAVYELRCDATL